MKKRFILLIDFSEYTGNLIRYACHWSKQTNAELLLVHQTTVLAPIFADNESKLQMSKHVYNEALQKLRTLAKELIPPTVKVSFSVSESHLQITLPGLLAEPFDNLIFAGIKGSGLLRKIFFGSVVIEVIDNIKNIIVAMPKEISAYSHAKLFIGVTEKHPFNILELNRFLNFVDSKNTSMTFFHLAKPNERTKDIEKHLKGLTALFAERFKTDFAVYEGSKPFDDIRKVINNKTDEMLIVQKGSRLLTDQLFRRFLINELVYEGQTPLVILP